VGQVWEGTANGVSWNETGELGKIIKDDAMSMMYFQEANKKAIRST
jgi:hypothetical protein